MQRPSEEGDPPLEDIPLLFPLLVNLGQEPAGLMLPGEIAARVRRTGVGFGLKTEYPNGWYSHAP